MSKEGFNRDLGCRGAQGRGGSRGVTAPPRGGTPSKFDGFHRGFGPKGGLRGGPQRRGWGKDVPGDLGHLAYP